MPAIDPSLLTSGAEWQIGGVGGASPSDAVGAAESAGDGGSFGSMLVDQIAGLEKQQVSAADASRALADGTATDPSAAVIAVERARLSMQLASQLRTKGTEALNDILHTQV